MKVASFYRFLDLDAAQEFSSALQSVCDEHKLLGTILVAAEGFNGSITGSENSIRTVFAWSWFHPHAWPEFTCSSFLSSVFVFPLE